MNESGATDQFGADESGHEIHQWLQEHKPDEKSIRSAFSAAARIIKAGRKEL